MPQAPLNPIVDNSSYVYFSLQINIFNINACTIIKFKAHGVINGACIFSGCINRSQRKRQMFSVIKTNVIKALDHVN